MKKGIFTMLAMAGLGMAVALAAGLRGDMQEAKQGAIQRLDKAPIDEKLVPEHAHKALLAENQVKKQQIAVLVRPKNNLTEERVG